MHVLFHSLQVKCVFIFILHDASTHLFKVAEHSLIGCGSLPDSFGCYLYIRLVAGINSNLARAKFIEKT